MPGVCRRCQVPRSPIEDAEVQASLLEGVERSLERRELRELFALAFVGMLISSLSLVAVFVLLDAMPVADVHRVAQLGLDLAIYFTVVIAVPTLALRALVPLAARRRWLRALPIRAARRVQSAESRLGGWQALQWLLGGTSNETLTKSLAASAEGDPAHANMLALLVLDGARVDDD
jgi:hypothetical protein